MGNSVLVFVTIVSIGVLVNGNHGYKILGIVPTISPSHWIVGSALMKGLAEKGHDVTVISPFPLKEPIRNYRDIPATTAIEKLKDFVENLLDVRKQTLKQSLTKFFEVGTNITKEMFKEQEVEGLLKSDEKFDVVIVELFANEANFGFGHHFKAPVVALSSFGANMWVCDMVGSPSPPSYVPTPFLGLPDKMTLLQRLENFFAVALERVLYDFYHMPKQEALYNKHFPDPKPPLQDLVRNVSLVLLNSHFSLGYPRPYSINMIEVGGMHVNRVSKPLPDKIKQFLDSANNGAIYFSMGSNIRGRNLGKEKLQAILSVFGSLKQKVLWKWETDTLPGKTDNIMISKWFPQDDILAHPNVKLFITHCGLLSTTESVYHGVPIVAIPILGDQPLNAVRAEKMGFGRVLAYDDLTEETLRERILDVLNDKSYAENIKRASANYRDQPMTPLETAIYWVEYVVRHKGAPHMRSAAQDLNFIQYHNLDVFAITIGLAVLVVYLMVKAFRYWCGLTSKMARKSAKEKSN